MLEGHFRSKRVRVRLDNSHLGAVFEDFVEYLAERGHRKSTIHQYTQAAEHFDRWLRRARVPVNSVDETVIARFLKKHIPKCRCPSPRCRTIHQTRAALKHLLVVLRQTGLVPAARLLDTPVERLVTGFVTHLSTQRGAAPSTYKCRARYAREFLESEFSGESIDFSEINASTITAFLGARHERWCPASMKVAATSLRSFFRYLQLIGFIDERLARTVPTIPVWRLASVPRVLDDDQMRAVLAAFDRRTPIGLRRYATTMCLAFMGMRSCEVSALTLDDIDWRAATVRVPATKTRRADILPLPDRVARAILAYLRHGRPSTTSRQIFVRHAPLGALAGPEVVRSAVRIACVRAGLDPHIGPHALRHTVATRMLRSGASLKQVADVLRHRSINTATIYAKVDISVLRDVAAPWPVRTV
jgi:integrase/recombinase XerD